MSEFFTFFLAATLISSIGMLLILLVKKMLKSHISARWQYNLGFLFFVLLAIPFIPSGLFANFNMGHMLNSLHLGEIASTSAALPAGEGAGIAYGLDWLQDFAVPVYHFAPGHMMAALMAIWVLGIIALAIVMLLCNRNLRLIKESVKPIENKEILAEFLRCKDDVGISGNVLLGSSVLVKTPMTVGFFNPQVILPATKISANAMRFAMLHELVHCKNKDIPLGGLICLFQIIYWFNPVVYFVFKQMKNDRELACDASVLNIIPRELHISYGETLLSFIKSISHPPMPLLAANIGGGKPQILKRIKHIASYTAETGRIKVKSICIFSLMIILILCKMPIISALADNNVDRFHFASENVLYEDLSYFFSEFEGSFVLYSLETGLYTIHNRDMSVTRVSPNSTYKIYSTLIALQTGVLDADNTFREWDGIIHPFETWNQNQDLASAMQYSTNWYFQDFDIQVGIEKLHYYLTHLSYGNRNLSGGITDFWIESSLLISPVEQVKILANLHRSNTVFDARHIYTLKDALRLYERGDAVLSGKTGSGFVNGMVVSGGRVTNGWFIGYVENNGYTYIFATYIQGEDNALGSVAAQITLSILEAKGLF